MSTAPKRNYSQEEYLTFERAASTKHEYYRGEIFAMSGASRHHNRISFNLSGVLHAQLKESDCEAYAADMRVHVPGTTLYTYPDVVVTCREPKFLDGQFDTLLNPQLIIEILSDSTANYDRGEKFEQYRQIDSLRDYILVAQDHPHIDRYFRNDQGQWVLVDATGLEATIELPTIACKLPLAEVYARVEFPPIEEVRRKAGLSSAEDEAREGRRRS